MAVWTAAQTALFLTASAGHRLYAVYHLRTVQEMLGHSSIVLTADTYISVVPELAFDAAERIAALII